MPYSQIVRKNYKSYVEVSFSFYCCKINCSNILQLKNHHLILFTDSVGQEFRKGTVGSLFLLYDIWSQLARLSNWRWWDSGRQESLGGVFTPMASAGCHLGTHLGLWAIPLCPLHVAWHRGVVFIMVSAPDLKDKGPQVSRSLSPCEPASRGHIVSNPLKSQTCPTQ